VTIGRWSCQTDSERYLHEKKNDAKTHFVSTHHKISGVVMKLTIGLVCLSAGAVCAGIPELDEGVYIQSGGGPLEVSSYSAPSVMDWDNDGRKDLLVGQFSNGNIWLFLNQGTDARPTFGSGQKVQAGGVNITTSYG
jgi:hypothetical protein